MNSRQQTLRELNQHYPINCELLKTLRTLDICRKEYKKTRRGKRGGKKKVKNEQQNPMRSAHNKRKIITHQHKKQEAAGHLHLISLNARSVCNKAAVIFDYIVENDPDILFIVETWLNDQNDAVLNELVPSGFEYIRADRVSGNRGGGILIIFKEALNLKKVESQNLFSSFEYLEGKLKHDNRVLTFLTIYRPPLSTANNSTPRTFLDEFQNFLLDKDINGRDFFVLGDINLHVNDQNDTLALDFLHIMESFNFQQHVEEPTHSGGNTLDLIFSPINKNIIKDLAVRTNHIADHKSIVFTINLEKPKILKRIIKSRNYTKFNVEKFQQDLNQSNLTQNVMKASTINDKMKIFNDTLAELLDKHAPFKLKEISNRPNTKWYTPEIAVLKRKRRKAEAIWRREKQFKHKDIYDKLKNETNKAIKDAKKEFIRKNIDKHRNDSKELFRLMNNLVTRKTPKQLPDHSCRQELAEQFNIYFEEKIHRIRDKIENLSNDVNFTTPAREIPVPLEYFTPLSEKEILEILNKSPSKSCQLDPVPTWIIKSCVIDLLPAITAIVNFSITQGDFPLILKKAHVIPLLKKNNLDPENMKNFRPVSNLNFISKIIEKAVVKRLCEHLTLNNITIPLQSAYKTGHSTETALLKVQNDIIHHLTNTNNVILLLLDLSAAFDTVDHKILLDRLEQLFGIKDDALAWFREYLAGRTQQVLIGDSLSTPSILNFGVPQGSVLGPFLFTLYTAPLVAIITQFGLGFHLYADDTQLYTPITSESADSTIKSIENVTRNIKSWMIENKLQLNEDKTELIVFKKKGSESVINEICVNGSRISQSPVVRNLGLYLDEFLTMNDHITKMCQSLYYHIGNVSRIRDVLDKESSKLLINSLVTSRLDYCNALLYGVSKFSTDRLQKLQNKAAKVITKSNRRDHVTPILKELHWLPVEKRIDYKIACIAYKCLHHDSAPKYLKSLIHLYHPPRSLRSFHSFKLDVPFPKTKTLDRTFTFSAPHVWNSLSLDTKKSVSYQCFKKKLKTELFHLAYF